MKQLFIALVICDSLLVAATGTIGFFVADRAGASFRLHFAAGLVTAVMLIFTHVVVFTYFVVTGKLIMRAAVAERVRPDAVSDAKRLKARAIRFAVPGIASIIVVTSTGAIAHQTPAAAVVHLGGFLFLTLLHGIAWMGQYGCLHRNGRLLDATLADYSEADPPGENALASQRVQRYHNRFVDRPGAAQSWQTG